MSRFVDKQVVRFWLDGEEGSDKDWVDLVTRLAYEDRAAIEQKLLGPSLVTAPAKPEGPAAEMSGDAKEAARIKGADPAAPANAEIAIAAANLELLKRTIIAWGGPGFALPDGQIAPVTERHIAKLDETAEKILGELQRRMVKPKKDFTQPPSLPTSTAGAEASTEAF